MLKTTTHWLNREKIPNGFKPFPSLPAVTIGGNVNNSQSRSLSESTSSSLLQRAKQQDPVAWERIAQLYTPRIYQICRQAGLHTSDAADVTQEVFRSVSVSLSKFRKEHSGDSFRGWLWTITRNKIRDHFRNMAKRPNATGGSSLQEQFQQLPEAPPLEDDDRAGEMRSSLLRRAMEIMQTDFEETTWQAFWLTAVEQQPAADVSDILGIKVPAVYMAKSRVLRRLREELDGMDLFD